MIKQTPHFALALLLALLITSGTAHAKWFGSKSDDSTSILSPRIRALAVGLENELKVLEILDENLQSVGKLSLREFAFSKAFTAPIVNGQLHFGTPDGVDEKGKPKFRLVASFDWQKSAQQVCLLFLPKSLMVDGKQSTTDYTIQSLDLSPQFKLGHISILNFTPFVANVRVGEHSTTIAAWDTDELTQVKELTAMNMAQFEVSYMQEGSEHNAFQSQTRFLNRIRYITLIYTDFKNDRVTVRIVKDSGGLFE